MKTILTILGLSGALLLPGAPALFQLPLEHEIKISDLSVPESGGSRSVDLPALPAIGGKKIVLRCRMVSYAPRPNGCNSNGAISFNGIALGRRTAAGDERLIGSEAGFRLKSHPGREFLRFAGTALNLVYAPDTSSGDAMSPDGQAASLLFDLSDVARGVDGNTLTFHNIRKWKAERNDLLVGDISVGYLDRKYQPVPADRIPLREPIADRIGSAGWQLAAGTGGGFTLITPTDTLHVESAMGMTESTPSAMIAADAASPVRTKIEKQADGFRFQAEWPGKITLDRTVTLHPDCAVWHETWTNHGDRRTGIPFRHRFFTAKAPQCLLSGDGDAVAMTSAPGHPTVFLESREKPGTGFGIAAESDWLRLLMALKTSGGVMELYTDTLSLAPGSSIAFDLVILSVAHDGYWDFINRLRARWNLNTMTMAAPFFWDTRQLRPGRTPAEQLRNTFAPLGNAFLGHQQWIPSSFDIDTIRTGRYPKLAPDAANAPGPCPDFDVTQFLTFRHRKPYYQALSEKVKTLHEVAPQAKLIALFHPAMAPVYTPLADRWSYADCEIKTADGKAFESETYSRGLLREAANRGFSVRYYLPSSGSRYLAELIRDAQRVLDQCDCDGIYFDEFGFCVNHRDYSRYDYRTQDGYSSDLDEQGNVIRLKSDNAYTSGVMQNAILDLAEARHKFFLGNGGAALMELTRRPHLRFIEGGNGAGAMAQAHLNHVPLVLGNFGDYTTRQGLFDGVKSALRAGCVYSPYRGHELLDDADNFISKLYPLTVLRLAPGTITGKERLITLHCGEFEWPVPDGRVALFRYDREGRRLAAGNAEVRNGRIALETPPEGLTVAELKP